MGHKPCIQFYHRLDRGYGLSEADRRLKMPGRLHKNALCLDDLMDVYYLD